MYVQGARSGGRTLRKGMFLPFMHLLRAFYDTSLSKNPSKNPCPCWSTYKAPSKF